MTTAPSTARCAAPTRPNRPSAASTEESDALLTELDAVSATLDTAALQKTYGTDRVAFLYFLPVSGASFTMVHYADDGSNFYHEYSCLYRYDVYAGEGPRNFAFIRRAGPVRGQQR